MNRNEIRRHEPSSRYLAVTSKHESTVARLNVFTMLPPYTGNLPPRQRREDVMNDVKVIP
jgi:hypothetical protein